MGFSRRNERKREAMVGTRIRGRGDRSGMKCYQVEETGSWLSFSLRKKGWGNEGV